MTFRLWKCLRLAYDICPATVLCSHNLEPLSQGHETSTLVQTVAAVSASNRWRRTGSASSEGAREIARKVNQSWQDVGALPLPSWSQALIPLLASEKRK